MQDTTSCWREIILSYEPSEDEGLDPETVSGLLMELGAEAVVDCSDGVFQAFVAGSRSNDLVHSAGSVGFKCISINEVEEQNWSKLNAELLSPLKVGAISVVPVAEPLSERSHDPNTIFIIPGTGFGTGHHESTATTLLFLQSDLIANPAPKRVLDVGTGSGILSIACAKLFNAQVTATDIDRLALDNASDNCHMNGVSGSIELLQIETPTDSSPYDLIVANIYAEVLVSLEDRFFSLLKPDCHIILSGVMPSRLDLLRSSFDGRTNGGRWINRREKVDGSWCTVMYQKVINQRV